MRDEITLIVPAKPEMMLAVRMALAGFCSQAGADIDTLDDIRTLSDEACYCLMQQARKAEKISICAVAEGDYASIRFEVTFDIERKDNSPRHDPEIAYGILSTLAADIRLSAKDGAMNAIEVDVHLGPL